MNQPPNAFTIRPAELADADNITRLMKSEPGFWNDRWPESIVARTLAAPTTIALVAVSGAEPAPMPPLASPAVRTQHQPPIAGFACAHHLGFRGYLSELIVAANHRGQGIASELLAAIEERLADQGCPLVITDAWRDAEAFYRQQGWSSPEAVLLRKRVRAS
jgi:ribosomal protein S18 acetylase RimI-like enzyme